MPDLMQAKIPETPMLDEGFKKTLDSVGNGIDGFIAKIGGWLDGVTASARENAAEGLSAIAAKVKDAPSQLKDMAQNLTPNLSLKPDSTPAVAQNIAKDIAPPAAAPEKSFASLTQGMNLGNFDCSSCSVADTGGLAVGTTQYSLAMQQTQSLGRA